MCLCVSECAVVALVARVIRTRWTLHCDRFSDDDRRIVWCGVLWVFVYIKFQTVCSSKQVNHTNTHAYSQLNSPPRRDKMRRNAARGTKLICVFNLHMARHIYTLRRATGQGISKTIITSERDDGRNTEDIVTLICAIARFVVCYLASPYITTLTEHCGNYSSASL